MKRISVCIATYNGEKYIKEQINSILLQLNDNDEIIISDDNSTDKTIDILKAYNDKRVKIYFNSKDKGYTPNFINALHHSQGKYIFIADQDDVWLPNKVKLTLNYFIEDHYQMVISDCIVVGENLEVIHNSFFETRGAQFGFIQTIKKAGYLGCCTAFHRSVYERALPFPKEYKYMPYDLWLGLIGYSFFNVATINDKLILYRRHTSNASDGGFKNKKSVLFKISYRLYGLYNIAINLLSNRGK